MQPWSSHSLSRVTLTDQLLQDPGLDFLFKKPFLLYIPEWDFLLVMFLAQGLGKKGRLWHRQCRCHHVC